MASSSAYLTPVSSANTFLCSSTIDRMGRLWVFMRYDCIFHLNNYNHSPSIFAPVSKKFRDRHTMPPISNTDERPLRPWTWGLPIKAHRIITVSVHALWIIMPFAIFWLLTLNFALASWNLRERHHASPQPHLLIATQQKGWRWAMQSPHPL